MCVISQYSSVGTK